MFPLKGREDRVISGMNRAPGAEAQRLASRGAGVMKDQQGARRGTAEREKG